MHVIHSVGFRIALVLGRHTLYEAELGTQIVYLHRFDIFFIGCVCAIVVNVITIVIASIFKAFLYCLTLLSRMASCNISIVGSCWLGLRL